MYNSIEITDSDDDMSGPTLDLPKLVSSAVEINEHTPEKRRKISISSATEATSVTTPGSTTSETRSNSPANTTNSTSNSKNEMQTKNQVRHRSRKTQLTVRNGLESEIQFETIQVDAQDQRVKENESLNIVIANMLNTDEMDAVVQRIANERVRCNFLLTTYHLPDMHFSLNTPLEMLKFQFHERLKLRRERSNVAIVTKPTTTNKNKVEQL